MTITLGRPGLRTPLYAVLSVSLILLSGCARPAPGETRPAAAPRLNSTSITQEEIRTAGAANAYDLVQSLRPKWLNMRGSIAHTPTEGDIVVYLGFARLGGLSALREVAATSLVTVEYLDPAKANYRFGRGHQFGAIILNTVSK
jgi:hypothetical protein